MRDTSKIETPGELNYIITEYLNRYLTSKGVSYATFNELVGVLECAKQELYRRVIAIYEDRKRLENGEIYLDEVISGG